MQTFSTSIKNTCLYSKNVTEHPRILTYSLFWNKWFLPKPFWIAIKNISASIWDISKKFGLLIDFDLLKAVTSTDRKPDVVFSRCGRHLEKWIWRHIFVMGTSIWTKFGSLMQNNVQISGKWSKSKPKVDFQYGWRLFFKNGSSYISAINWDMSTKFDLLIDFDLLKATISTIAKPDVVLSGCGRHLDKAI